MKYQEYLAGNLSLSFEERCEIREYEICDWDNRRLRKFGKILDIFQGFCGMAVIAIPIIFGILANMSGF